jgi:hypothetical protein
MTSVLAHRMELFVVDHDAPWVRVRVRKPGALRFADSIGLVIHRRPGDFMATPDTQDVVDGAALPGGHESQR